MVMPGTGTACPWCSRAYSAADEPLSASQTGAQLRVDHRAAPAPASVMPAIWRAAPVVGAYVFGMVVASAVWAVFVLG